MGPRFRTYPWALTSRAVLPPPPEFNISMHVDGFECRVSYIYHGFVWIWIDLDGFGWIWMDLDGFDCIFIDLIGFG